MRKVTVHKIIIKGGNYEILWETLIVGEFGISHVHDALDRVGNCMIKSDKDAAKSILDYCGLPKVGEEVCYHRIAGTIIGLVSVKKKKAWIND